MLLLILALIAGTEAPDDVGSYSGDVEIFVLNDTISKEVRQKNSCSLLYLYVFGVEEALVNDTY